ncbi:hypothetical protein ACHAWF_003516 [Thalassiosira exigua]
MAPIEVSATVAAAPETVWNACFEPMKWEAWDPDLKEVTDVSTPGSCREGTTCTFAMNDGSRIPISLSNVVRNESVDFKGGVAGGLVKATGKVRITPVDDDAPNAPTSRIEYSFELGGLLGSLVGMVKKRECVEGTQGGLDNMVKLSEEAQKR